MKDRDRVVVIRFILKSALLTFFAALRWRSDFLTTLSTLFMLAALLNVILALYRKEKIHRGALGYWDEAGASLLIVLVALTWA